MPAVAEQVHVPELRFPQFLGDWRELALQQLVVLVSGQHLNPDQYDYSQTGIPYLTGPSDFTEGEASKFTSVGKCHAAKGDVVITVKGSGVGQLWTCHFDESSLGRQLMAVKGRNCLSQLVYYLLGTREALLQALAAGNMIPGLSRSDILSLKFAVPSIEEQEKIAGFLTAVDKRIGKLKGKKELLEEYKRGMMQKLFSQEVRFKDEHGRHYPDWEVRQLGELLLERVESGESESVMLSVTIKSGIRRFDELGRKDNSNPDKSKYKRLVAGDIAYNTLRLWQGASGLAQETGFVSPAYTVLRGDKSLVSMPFVSYWMKLDSVIFLFQRNSQGLTSDQWTCKYPVFSRIKWPFPSLEEQERIAEFLTGLDEKLANLGQRIEKAEEFKRGLLQKMFV